MKTTNMKIKSIPAIIWGEKSDNIYIYVHGKGSRKEEAEKLAEEGIKKGFQVISFDFPEHGERTNSRGSFIIQNCVHDLKAVYNYVSNNWQRVSIYASSIGAYFSLVAFENITFDKCLFESPVVDMEKLITNMMRWFGVTEDDLERKGVIEIPNGETLSWAYLEYVRENKIADWKSKTHIIYGDKDILAEKDVVDGF